MNLFRSKTTLRLRNSTSRSRLRHGLFLTALALACFAFLPAAQALLPPPAPDGGYPGQNTAEGDGALFGLTSGEKNTAVGFDALLTNNTGSFNTAIGDETLLNNSTGTDNTATGVQALFSNTAGFNNTDNGSQALESNTFGSYNTATGSQALESNTIGSYNTAIGPGALQVNTTGEKNTAIGFNALFGNTTGGSNTASGDLALFSNTTGGFNAANGANALEFNTTGGNNVANGGLALYSNTTGGDNVAVGIGALSGNTTGSSNVAIGPGAGENLTTGSNNIDIGNEGVAGESGTIRIGTQGGRVPGQTRTFIAGINGVTVRGTPVFVNADGQLGTTPSSQRFKTEIKPMDKASEAILALKPVTFRYKKAIDPDATQQFGLVAEEVEKVNPALVVRDAAGKPYTVRYEAVNAMLLNEFLKEHRTVQEQNRKIQEQEGTIAKLKSALAKQETVDAEQQKQIEALTAGLQKVSEQMEMSRPAPRVVDNRQ